MLSQSSHINDSFNTHLATFPSEAGISARNNQEVITNNGGMESYIGYNAVEVVFTIVLGSLGITVGCLVILVLSYRRKPSASERLVVGLSFSEVFFNVCYIGVVLAQRFFMLKGAKKESRTMMLFESINYFLFGFCVISSYLLILTATISRYYAICRIHEFKRAFNKSRVNRLVALAFLSGLLQGTLNGSFLWIPNILRQIVDYEFAIVLSFFLIFDSVTMFLVYLKVIRKFRKLRIRLALNGVQNNPQQNLEPAMKHTLLTFPDNRKQSSAADRLTVTVSECPYSCSRLPSAVDAQLCDKVKRDVENKENVGKTDSGTSKGSNPCKQASPAPLKQMDKNIHKGRYHYSREVSISLLLISIVYVCCVTPFTIYYVLNFVNLTNNATLRLLTNLILQLKFVLNPIIYTRSSTFKTRFRRVCRRMQSHRTPAANNSNGQGAVARNNTSSFRKLFGSNTVDL